MDAKTISIGNVGAIYQRRKLPIYLTLLVITAIGAAFAYSLPAVYQSTATILVEQNEIPEELIESGVTELGIDEIQATNQLVMTSQNLSKIAREAALYPEFQATLSEAEIAAMVGANASISVNSSERIHPRTGRPFMEATSFFVSFDDESPEKAQKAAAMFADLYLEINHQHRTQRAAGASDFFAEEANRLSKTIAGLEERLAEFKRNNLNLLPESVQMNRQLLDRAQQDYTAEQGRLRSLEDKKASLEFQLAQAEPVEDQLTIARTQLAEALQRFTDSHPDVIRLRSTIASLEQARKGSPSTYRPGAPSSDRTVTALQTQLQTVNADMAASRNQLNILKQQIEAYHARLTSSPEVEREYLSATRDYENALTKYREIKNKEMEAKLAEQLELEKKGSHFSLLQPPGVPTEPIKPNRPGILIISFMFALIASVMLASLLEFLDPTVRGVDGVTSVLNAPPLGIIPHIRARTT